MRNSIRALLAGGALALAGQLVGCGQTAWPEHDGSILLDPDASSLEFWPPTSGYLCKGDSALLRVRGLKRVYSCARLLELRAEIRPSTGDSQTIRVRTSLELPPNAACALDPDGLDTALRIGLFQAGGSRIFLVNGTAVSPRADTVVEGLSRLDSLDFTPDSTRTARLGKFLFLDSSASQSKRRLVSDSLAKCEAFQGAVFERMGAAYRVRFRRLQLDSVLHATFPPCSGIHGDSVETVADQFGYSQQP